MFFHLVSTYPLASLTYPSAVYNYYICILYLNIVSVSQNRIQNLRLEFGCLFRKVLLFPVFGRLDNRLVDLAQANPNQQPKGGRPRQ